MAAICENLPDPIMVAVFTGMFAFGGLAVASFTAAPILVGCALGAAAGLIATVAWEILHKSFRIENELKGLLLIAVYIPASLAVAGAFVLLGAPVAFGTAVLITLLGLPTAMTALTICKIAADEFC